MSKQKKLAIFLSGLLLILLVVAVISQTATIVNQKDQIKKQEEVITQQEELITQLEASQVVYELDNCPVCGGNVVIQQVVDSFYILCEKCELRTDYFGSEKELVEYWNKER